MPQGHALRAWFTGSNHNAESIALYPSCPENFEIHLDAVPKSDMLSNNTSREDRAVDYDDLTQERHMECSICKERELKAADEKASGVCGFCSREQKFKEFALSCGLTRFPDTRGERYVYYTSGRIAGKKSEEVSLIDELWNALVRSKGASKELMVPVKRMKAYYVRYGEFVECEVTSIAAPGRWGRGRDFWAVVNGNREKVHDYDLKEFTDKNTEKANKIKALEKESEKISNEIDKLKEAMTPFVIPKDVERRRHTSKKPG
jgi:hypothetical protein